MVATERLSLEELRGWREAFLRNRSGNESIFVGVDFGDARIHSVIHPRCLATRKDGEISGVILFSPQEPNDNPIIVSVWTPRYKPIDEEVANSLISGAIEEIEKTNKEKIHVHKLFGPAWKYLDFFKNFPEKIEIIGQDELALLTHKLIAFGSDAEGEEDE